MLNIDLLYRVLYIMIYHILCANSNITLIFTISIDFTYLSFFLNILTIFSTFKPVFLLFEQIKQLFQFISHV